MITITILIENFIYLTIACSSKSHFEIFWAASDIPKPFIIERLKYKRLCSSRISIILKICNVEIRVFSIIVQSIGSIGFPAPFENCSGGVSQISKLK